MISGTLSHGLPHVLRSVNIRLSKPIQSSSKSHSVQKHIVSLNTTDLRADLDETAKIHSIGHNNLAKSHLVWPIGLSKPEYCRKELQKVKVV